MANIDISNINFSNPRGANRDDLSSYHVLVMIPCYGQMDTKAVQSLLDLQAHMQHSNVGRFNIMIESGNAMITHARNRLVGGNLANRLDQRPHEGFTDFFFIDADIGYTPDQFIKILTGEHDIMSGVYFGKNEHKLPIAYHWDEEHFKKHMCMPTLAIEELTGGHVVAGYCGMGFCRIKREVFEKLPYPWFNTEPFTIDEYHDINSEDASFCRRVTELNFPVVVDTSVRLEHYGNYTYERNQT